MKNFFKISIIIIAINLQAQDKSGLYFGPGISLNSYYGKINNSENIPNFNKGYDIIINYLKNRFEISLLTSISTYSNTNNQIDINKSIQAKYNTINFNLGYDIVKIKQARINFTLGIGYINSNIYEDKYSKDNQYYYLWNDRTIRNLPQKNNNIEQSKIIQRDYNFETFLKNETSIIYVIGLKYKMYVGQRTNISLAINSNKYINNNNNLVPNLIIETKINIAYRITGGWKELKLKKDKIKEFNKIILLDTDKDNILDLFDNCPNSPKGIMVDKLGCCTDTDADGVPDYKDQEINSNNPTYINLNGKQLEYNYLPKDEIIETLISLTINDLNILLIKTKQEYEREKNNTTKFILERRINKINYEIKRKTLLLEYNKEEQNLKQ